jgi:hypothetical protein
MFRADAIGENAMKLTSAKIARSGRTAKTWNHENDDVRLVKDADALDLRFSLSSKGGGITDVQLAIGADDFPRLLDAMVGVDRKGSVAAMAAIIATETAKHAAYDHVVRRGAREAVVQAAASDFKKAPKDRNLTERLTMEVVRQLVDRLNKSDQVDESSAEAAE